MRRELGAAVLALHRVYVRARDKLWSLAIGGGFDGFGRRSVLALPCRLEGTKQITIGAGVWLGPNSWLQCVSENDDIPRLQVGNRVHASGALVLSCAREIVVEDDVLFARNVYVSDHIHGYDDPDRPIHEQGIAKQAAVRIEQGAWLGQNVVVCPGVTIGRGSVIGAGSLVNQDVPAHCVAVGAPARVVKCFAAARSERAARHEAEVQPCPQ